MDQESKFREWFVPPIVVPVFLGLVLLVSVWLRS